MPEVLAAFRGPVSCRRTFDAAGIVLCGCTAEAPAEATTITFAATTDQDLPDTLTDARVESLGERCWRVSTATRSWFIEGGTAHVHCDVAASFYRAIPPRKVRRTRRLSWNLVLILAATRLGMGVLRLLRR